MRRSWRYLKYPLGVSLTALLVWLLLRGVPFVAVGQIIRHAQPLFAAPILAVILLRYLLRALRWRRLVRHLRYVTVRQSLDRVLISQVADRTLPFDLGYLTIVQIAAEKFQLYRSQLFGVELLELMLDGLLYAIFLGIGLATLPIGVAFSGLAVFMLCGACSGLALAWWATRYPVRSRVPSSWPFAQELRRFLQGLRSIQDRRRTIHVFLFTVEIWVTDAVLYWLVGMSLGVHASPLIFVFLVGAANLGASVPFVHSAVGFVFVAQQALLAVGQPSGQSTALALMLEALLILPLAVLGPLAILDLRVKLADLLPRKRAWPEGEKGNERCDETPV